jgi:hypothetical protein
MVILGFAVVFVVRAFWITMLDEFVVLRRRTTNIPAPVGDVALPMFVNTPDDTLVTVPRQTEEYMATLLLLFTIDHVDPVWLLPTLLVDVVPV